MSKKRGVTNAGNIATLISLIALFMIVYILLLPQADRNKLLYGDEKGAVTKDAGTGKVLLSEFIGKLSESGTPRMVTHDISNVNLFTTQSSDLATISENILVSKGLFTSKPQNVFFNVANPKDLLKAELYIVVSRGEGDLTMKVNGYEFYRNSIPSGQVKVEIPLYYITENNMLELSVEGFGSNSYEIKEIKLRRSGEIKNRAARRTFSISSDEKSKMERGVMRYSVFCNRDEKSSLKMLLNNKVLFSDVPFCNLKEDVIEIAPEYFNAGINYLDFETEGDYVIEGLVLKTFMGEEEMPEYYFTLSDEEFRSVRRGLQDVVGTFEFSIMDERKGFTLLVNGEEVNVDTTDDTHLIVLSNYIEKENLIKIDAKNSFEILEFKVTLE